MKFYAVKIGRQTGIYPSWDLCQIQVKGFSGAQFKSFNTELQAQEYLGIPIQNDNVDPKPKLKVKPKLFDLSVLYVDGGHNRQTGKEAWGRCTDRHGQDLGHEYSHLFSDLELRDVTLSVGPSTVVISVFNDVTQQQNNGAELLAMIMGLRIALSSDILISTEIRSDSKLIIESWSHGRVSMKGRDLRKVNYINELVKLRQEYERRGGKIVKISGDDNKADLGKHIKK